MLNLFDLHCDTFTELFKRNINLDGNMTDVNVDELSGFSFCAETFATWVSGMETDPKGSMYDVFQYGKNELTRLRIPVIETGDDLKRCFKNGGTAAMLSLEGCDGITSTEDIDKLYTEGVRTVSLTWNGKNRFAGGALSGGGLTEEGRCLLRHISKTGMVPDLAHLNRQSFFDAVSVAENCIVTHSGVDAVVNHPRNLTDDQLRCIKERNGIVGICVYPGFIGDDPVDGFIRSIDRAMTLGLADNIAVGTDFDGAAMKPLIEKPSDLKLLYGKVAEFYGSREIADKIFYKNAYNFYVNVLTNKNK